MQSFFKEERLCRKKDIELLLNGTDKFYQNPFSVKWITLPFSEKFPVKLLVIVPKRYFKKSVERNRIKRFIREAYRRNKEVLIGSLKEKNKSIALMLLYGDKKTASYQEAEIKIKLILHFLAEKI